MDIGYNRKVVGKYGEVYKHGSGRFGIYTRSRTIAKKLLKLEGAIRHQFGDDETTVSVPETAWPVICQILDIKDNASLRRD